MQESATALFVQKNIEGEFWVQPQTRGPSVTLMMDKTNKDRVYNYLQ